MGEDQGGGYNDMVIYLNGIHIDANNHVGWLSWVHKLGMQIAEMIATGHETQKGVQKPCWNY